MARWQQRVKRAFDLTVLISAHILLAPVWLLLWLIVPIAIAIEGGRPIFFSSDRVGLNGRVFRAYKFRTMVPDAHLTGPSITAPNDPRITRVGRLLRKTALDEVPQLYSILRGDMSFVGPRAYGVESHELYVDLDPRFERRLAVTPGLTGLAAVYGNPDDPQHRLCLDLLYIRKRSLFLDIKLLLVSVWIAVSFGWERKQPPEKLRPRSHRRPAQEHS